MDAPDSVEPLQAANEAMKAVSAALLKMNELERDVFRKRHVNYLIPSSSDSRLLSLPTEVQSMILGLVSSPIVALDIRRSWGNSYHIEFYGT